MTSDPQRLIDPGTHDPDQNDTAILQIMDTIDERILELSQTVDGATFATSRTTAPWELSLNPSDVVAELSALKAQRTVWTFLNGISSEERCDGDMSRVHTRSHRIAMEEIVKRSDVLRRAQSLAIWSEEDHRLRNQEENSSIPMDWSTPCSHTLTSPSTSLDPDGVWRDGTRIHPEDVKTETMFWHYVWQLLLSGRLTQGDENLRIPSVFQLCQAFGHDWRAVSLSGGLPYHVEQGQIEGNPHRWLWLHTCRQLASQDGASVWERAVYGILSGDIANVLPACSTWQQYIWATCTCYLIVHRDQLLYDYLRSSQDFRVCEPLDPEQLVVRPTPLSIGQLLDKAESAFFQAHPDAHKDSYNRVIKYLAVDNFQEVANELYSTMDSQSSDRSYHRPSYIEFAARLYLTLVHAPTEDDINSRIIVHYIRYLSTTPDLQHLIPEATLALPEPIKIEEYAAVLRACANNATREWFLGRAAELFSPEVVHQIQQRLLVMMVPARTEDGEFISKDVDDLIACQGLHISTAIHQANIFFRQFIADNQFDDAVHLYTLFARPEPPFEQPDDAREFFCWSALIKARCKLQDLERYLSKRPNIIAPVLGKRDASEVLDNMQYGPTKQDLAIWNETKESFFDIARRAVLDVVRFENGWMRFDDPKIDAELAPYRLMCLPDLVLRMFSSAEAFDADHSAECLNVTFAVSETQFRAYESFDDEHMDFLLKATRDAYIRYAAAIA
uniref:Nuclear pore complex protein n=2 Tax=Spongospora subterranea TaxID=70186 RepID=A0A0H5QSZ9_9EUKA|eukprot:CRZ05148.1 hypothetical protein [Spongospora subterranea]